MNLFLHGIVGEEPVILAHVGSQLTEQADALTDRRKGLSPALLLNGHQGADKA
jgi:hypothetical protein